MSRTFYSSNPGLLVGLAIVGLFIAMAMFPGLFSSQDPAGLRLEHRLSAPSATNWFGTDGVGVDVYSRVVHGARTTLATIVVVLGIAIFVGVGLGSVSGYLGGWIDGLLMRVADVFLAFPPLILALATNAVLGRGLQQTMFAVAFLWWPAYARLVRSQVLAVRKLEFVESARAIGATELRIVGRHVLPNVMGPVIVMVSAGLAGVAGSEIFLSFLGIGIQPPTPSLGLMIFENGSISVLRSDPHLLLFPVLTLSLLLFTFNLLGDAVNDAFNPRAR